MRREAHALSGPEARDVYPDDASGCVAAALKQAIERFGAPAATLSDNGSRLVGRNGRGKGAPNSRVPAALGAAPPDRGIEPVNPGPYHPQTNGKPERFHRTAEEGIGRFESLSAYMEHCNTDGLHRSPDIDDCETPILAFGNKAAAEEIGKNNPKWMGEDTRHGAT